MPNVTIPAIPLSENTISGVTQTETPRTPSHSTVNGLTLTETPPQPGVGVTNGTKYIVGNR